MKKIPTKNVFAESLPNYGYITIQNVGSNQIFVWHGKNKKENAVVSWEGQNAKSTQIKLNQLARKTEKLKLKPTDFYQQFKVVYQND